MEKPASFKLSFFPVSATFLIVQHGILGFETWQEKVISPHFSCQLSQPNKLFSKLPRLKRNGSGEVFFFSSARSLVVQNLPMWSETWQEKTHLPILNASKSNKLRALICRMGRLSSKSRKLLSWFTMMLPPTCWSSLDRCPNLLVRIFLLSHLQPILLTAIADFFFQLAGNPPISFLNLFYLKLWVTLRHHLQASLLSKLRSEPWV